MGGEGGEKLGEGVEGDPSRRQRERDEAEALRMREIPSPSAPSLSTSPPPFAEPFQPPPFFPLSLSGGGCGGAGLGRLRMQELGEGTRTRASSHAPSRGSREPGRDRAQRDASSGSGVRPARSRSTWILATQQVRKGLGCWHNSSLLERPGGESLPPANQPSLVRPSNKAYTGG